MEKELRSRIKISGREVWSFSRWSRYHDIMTIQQYLIAFLKREETGLTNQDSQALIWVGGEATARQLVFSEQRHLRGNPFQELEDG